MPRDITDGDLQLRDHRFGRINRRMPIGPARWPFYDLFWIHEGRAQLRFPELAQSVDLAAPAGVLILPGTLFEGGTQAAFATASICHFEMPSGEGGPGFRLPRADEELHIQTMLRLAMTLARRDRPADVPRRVRLLQAILDGFAPQIAGEAMVEDDRLAVTWRQAGQNLARMRTLTDVAALLGIGKSAFRALHRKTWNTSAGEHLRDLRLTRAEELLVGTDLSLAEIARAVGYGHASTLSAAFRERRGKTPGEYRHWSNPIA